MMASRSIFLGLIFLPAISFALTRANSGEVVLPVKEVPESLVPSRFVSIDDTNISRNLIQTLFRMGVGYRLDPVLADRVEWQNDGKRLRIKLKKVSFSNGAKLRAIDIVEAIRRCASDARRSGNYSLQKIEGFDKIGKLGPSALGVKALSEDEVEINLTSPAPLLVEDLAHHTCAPIQASPNGEFDLLKGASGTGPFIVESRSKDRLVLKVRPDIAKSWKGPDKVIFKVTDAWGDFSKMKKDFDLIVGDGTPPGDVEFNFYPYSQLAFAHLSFNNSRPPFDKKAVREAVYRAVDLSEVVKALNLNSRLQGSLIPYGVAGFRERPKDRDLDIVRRLLAQSGYSDQLPLEFEILLARGAYSDLEAQAWLKAFPNVPIRPRVIIADQAEVFKRRRAGNFEAVRLMKFPGSIDPYRVIVAYLAEAETNTPKANLPECDKHVESALLESDFDRRKSLYRNADSCYMGNFILLPIGSPKPGFIAIRKPWRLNRTSQYSPLNFEVGEWLPRE